MKKYIILLVLAIFITLSACNNTSSNPQNNDLYIQTYDVTSFDLQNFLKVNNMDYDFIYNVGKINSAVDAVEKAKEIWKNEFGEISGTYYDPTEGRRVNIAYDINHDCWLLTGTLPEDTFGTVPIVLIKTNGDVMAIYMSGYSGTHETGD